MRDGPPLDGRVALVTGASRGIGRAVALHPAAEGAACAGGYASSVDAATEVVDEIAAAGGRAIAGRGDVSDPAVLDGIVARVVAGLGPIDVLIADAGVGDRRQPMVEVPLETWDETIRVKRGFCRIVLMSSVAAFTAGMIGPHYAASKAGLMDLTRWMAAELAGDGITVNAIAPALVQSDITPPDPDRRSELASRIPVGRLGTAEEVADLTSAVVRNGYLTNQVIPLDGGLHPH